MNKGCFRNNCKFMHSTVEDEEKFYSTGIFPREIRSTPVCTGYLRGLCSNQDCHLTHPPNVVGNEGLPVHVALPPPNFNRPPPSFRDEDSPPEAKFRRYTFEENFDPQVLNTSNICANCENLDHKVKLLHDNISVLLKKVADLTEKNVQLTSMNEFLLEQTASVRSEPSTCVITSRHGTSAPVSLATVSVTPVVSLAGALPALVPAAATPNLALAPAASRAQLLTPAPQLLTVSTTQQLVGNSGALIVTSAGAQQLMQVSDSGTLMGGGQTVVAVPAQLTLAPPTQQLMSNASQTAVQQLVQQSALQPQVVSQHQASQYAAQQSVQHLAAAQQSAQHLAAQQSAQHLAAQQSAQHLAAQQSAQQHLAAQQSAQLAAQQSAQHLAAQQSAQHLAAQQSAQHLAAQQSAQHLAAAQQSAQQLAAAAQQSAQQMVAQQSAQQLAAQQSAQQQLVPSAQHLVHQTSTQQITISSTSQPMALPNSQAQPITFPIISQSILPH
ncbi:probable basic-leucine zipper transcription factor P isoform X2 [Plodia interpunctella]|uniref:probable basic-leucine zipper transcription factor P isoform X2 n=1 Tax=Plodia interpunctella TaxID=58824 RepID=UPI0023677B34|nr:probable basic-leucine zipper transcription factor P isoform X2 [Plodia interpunctella]